MKFMEERSRFLNKGTVYIYVLTLRHQVSAKMAFPVVRGNLENPEAVEALGVTETALLPLARGEMEVWVVWVFPHPFPSMEQRLCPDLAARADLAATPFVRPAMVPMEIRVA